MALREGLPNNMLYVDKASTMSNFVIVVAWHGGSPIFEGHYSLSRESP